MQWSSMFARCCQEDLEAILIVGIVLFEMHLSHTHSAESSPVSRLYATLLIPVHSRWYHRSHPLSQYMASWWSCTSWPHPPQGYSSLDTPPPTTSCSLPEASVSLYTGYSVQVWLFICIKNLPQLQTLSSAQRSICHWTRLPSCIQK